MPALTPDPRHSLRRINLIGIVALLVMFGGFGVWAATTQISGAVIAPGIVVVETNIKKVQHPTGGVIGEILVRDGQIVNAGDIVMRLDDTVTRATLGVIRTQLDELWTREARLTAERDDAHVIIFPEELLARSNAPAIASRLASEEKLFESRSSSRLGQSNQLRERIKQAGEEIRGLSAQQQAKQEEIELIDEELLGVRDLYDKRLVQISRLMVLQRDKARLNGEHGQFIAEIARARGKINENELQIIQIERDFRTDVLKDLRDVQGKIAELRERLVAAEDQLKRVDIRAPQRGTVLQLAVHTVGGVIGNGETLMQIVPLEDSLVIDARVWPQDIDQVALGSKVVVRIMAGNQRLMQDLHGTLSRVSADLERDPPAGGQPGASYYQVRVTLEPTELERISDLRLVPGMPAEVFIQTYARGHHWPTSQSRSAIRSRARFESGNCFDEG
jgi:HlyD family secretion protein